MGFGNAAGSFMTGFMAGYKFIDDAEKKQQEIKALKDKAEAELTTEKNKFIGEQSTDTRQLQLDFQKLDEEMAKEIKDLSDPKAIMSIRNNYDDKKVALTATYNDKIGKQNIAVINTPLEQFAAKPVVYNSSKLFDVTAVDGTTFVVSNASEFGKKLENDLKNPVGQRQYIIEKGGYVLTTNASKEKVAIDINGNTANDDVSAVRLQNINQLITKKPEAITANTAFDSSKLPDKTKQALIDAGYDLTILTYGMLQEFYKQQSGANLLSNPTMLINDKGQEIVVSTRKEMEEAAKKRYKIKPSPSESLTSINIEQYKNRPASEQNLTYKQWEALQTEQGKIGATEKTMFNANVKDMAKLKDFPPEVNKAYFKSMDNVTSYQNLQYLIRITEEGQKSGAFNQGPFNTLWNNIIQYTPAKIQEELSGKTPKQLMDQYSISAAAADFVNRYVLFMTGQAATDTQTQRYVNTVIGSNYKNPQSTINQLKGFSIQLQNQIDTDAQRYQGYGLNNFGENWAAIKGGGKSNTSSNNSGGQIPPKKSNIKPKWDPYLNKKGQ